MSKTLKSAGHVLGLGGLAVLGTTAMASPSSLLPLGSDPPRLSLPSSGGRTFTLEKFLRRDRIVLVFIPTKAERRGAVYLEAVRANAAQYRERDLVVLAVVPADSSLATQPSHPPVYVLVDRNGVAGRRFKVAPRRPVCYLIGKDRGIKTARQAFPVQRELFGTIDAMPMRRQEMKRSPR